MIDLHCHILPGIDDGAENFEQALEMARIAQQDGIKTILATPHYIRGSIENNTKVNVINCTGELNAVLSQHKIDVLILPGCEVFLTPELPDLVATDEIITLNNSRYVLIELPMNSIPPYTEQVLYELQLAGKVPIIAHPERNREVQTKPEILLPYIARGIHLQVNTGSCLGLFGKHAEKTAWKLIHSGIVGMISSDAHTTHKRSPKLSYVYKQIEEKYSTEIAQQLFLRNPERIINDQEIVLYTSDFKSRSKRNIFSIFSDMINKWVAGT